MYGLGCFNQIDKHQVFNNLDIIHLYLYRAHSIVDIDRIHLNKYRAYIVDIDRIHLYQYTAYIVDIDIIHLYQYRAYIVDIDRINLNQYRA